MRARGLLMLAALAACAFGLAYCGSDNPVQQGLDASTNNLSPDHPTASACTYSSDCAQGDCLAGACVACTQTSCGAGHVCGADQKCVLATGIDASVIAGLDAAAPSCASRNDCATGLVCRSGLCQVPDPTGHCVNDNECLPGKLCDTNGSGVCVSACVSNVDCSGLTNDAGVALPHCDPSSHECVPCVNSTDCPNNHVCTNGVCVPACSCGGSVPRQCGDDGCGHSCGVCSTGQFCANGTCVNGVPDGGAHPADAGPHPTDGGCKPACGSAVCGDDGCGGSCGTCGAGQTCSLGQCQGGSSDAGLAPGTCDNTCSGCPSDQVCSCGGVVDCSPTVGCFGTGTCITPSDAGVPASTDGGGTAPGTCDDTCVGCAADEICSCGGFFNCSPSYGCMGYGTCVAATSTDGGTPLSGDAGVAPGSCDDTCSGCAANEDCMCFGGLLSCTSLGSCLGLGGTCVSADVDGGVPASFDAGLPSSADASVPADSDAGLAPGSCDDSCNGCGPSETCTCFGLFACNPANGCMGYGTCVAASPDAG